MLVGLDGSSRFHISLASVCARTLSLVATS